MVRTVVADSSLEKYLDKLLEIEQFSYGIIIGQATQQAKDSVIHLAKTEEDASKDDSTESKDSSQKSVKVNNVENINSLLIVDHALNALRMLPGSFFVLGIFVATPQNVFENSSDFKTLKTVLQQLTEVLKTNNNDNYGCSDEFDGGEKLILHYGGKRSVSCRTIDVRDLAKAGSGKPVEWKFQDKFTQWQEIETIYDIDEVLNIKSNSGSDCDVEANFDMAINSIQQKLSDCVLFLDGEPVNNPTESVENYTKQKKGRENDTSTFILNGSIYYLCDKIGDHERVIRYDGTAKYSGIICSKVWVTPKVTMEDVQKFVKMDILRSISSRLRMYVDAQHQSSQVVLVREPPRRVFFKLKSCPVMFSDYLFRGESNDTIIIQGKSNMDVDLEMEDILDDIETMPDEICYDEDTTDEDIKPPVDKPGNQTNRLLYTMGIICAVGILLISVGVHVLLNSNDED